MAGDLDKDDRSMFRQMLIVDAIRGHHSTGVAAVTPKGDMSVFKRALSPIDFMQMRQYDDVVAWDSQVLIGHNRYATVGKINHATAHPFEFDNIVGAHNGTLKGWMGDLRDSGKFTVDSECLLHNINEYGIEEVIPKISGAWALTLYNKEKHAIQLLRNKERPLYFAVKKGQRALYWASEAWMIRNMANRCGIEIEGQISAVKENTLVTLPLPTTKTGQMGEAVGAKLSGAKEKKYQSTQSQSNYQPRRVGNNQSGTSSNATSRQASGSGSCTNRSGGDKPVGVRVGERIQFVPIGEAKSPFSDSKFIEGVMTVSPFVTVRIYIQNQNLIKEILGEWECVEGAVTAVSPEDRPNDGDDAYVIVPATGLVRIGSKKEEDDVPTEEEEDQGPLYTNGPGNSLLTREEFKVKSKHGCGWCASDVEFEDVVEWYGDDPICEHCWPDIQDNKHLN